MDERLKVHVRWLIKRDMAEVLAIERASFEFPWFEEDFIRCLRERSTTGMVAERGDSVIGFLIYRLDKTRQHLLSFAVAPRERRHSVGRQMIAKLTDGESFKKRNCMTLTVSRVEPWRATVLPQRGLSCGERAAELLRGFARGRVLHAAAGRHG